MTFALFRISSTWGGNYRRPYGNSKCLQSKDPSTTPFRGCRSRQRRLVSLEKNFYVYKVYKQFGSRSGLTECQAYSVKPGQVPNCLLLSSPIVWVIVLLISISARARAQEQGPISSSQRSKGTPYLNKNSAKSFCVFFFCFLLLLFFILSKLALPGVMLMQVWAKQVHKIDRI